MRKPVGKTTRLGAIPENTKNKYLPHYANPPVLTPQLFGDILFADVPPLGEPLP